MKDVHKTRTNLIDFVGVLIFALLLLLLYFFYQNSKILLEQLKFEHAERIVKIHNPVNFLKDSLFTRLQEGVPTSENFSFHGKNFNIYFYTVDNSITSFQPDKWEEKSINELKSLPDSAYFSRFYSLNHEEYYEFLGKLSTSEVKINIPGINSNEIIYFKFSIPSEKLFSKAFIQLQFLLIKKYFITLVLLITLFIIIYYYVRKKSKKYDDLLNKYISESNSNLEIFQLSPNPIFIGDNKGKFTFFNKAAIDLTGYSEEELINMSIEQLFPDVVLDIKPLDYKSVLSGKTVIAERTLLRKDGSKAVVKMFSKKLSNSKLISTMVDISEERMKTERILQIKNMLEQSILLTKSATTFINYTTNQDLLSFGLKELFRIQTDKTITCNDLYKRIDTKDLQFINTRRKELDESRNFFSIEYTVKLDSGKTIWLYHTEKLIVDEETKQKFIVVNIRDITETKRQRNFLEESERFFKKIFDTAQVGLAVFDTKKALIEMRRIFNGEITEEKIKNLTNNEIKELLKLTPIKKFNYKLLEIIDERNSDDFTLDLFIEEKDYSIIKKVYYNILIKEDSIEVELGIRNPKTKEYRLGLCRMTLPKPPYDFNIYVSWTDITELKRIENELRNNLQFSQKFLDSAPLVVVMMDKSGNVVLMNRYAEKVLGITFNEIKNKNFFTVFKSEEKAIVAQEKFDRIVDKDVDSYLHQIVKLTQEGKDYAIRLFISTIKDENDKVEGIISFGLDVTTENRTKEELNLTTAEIIKLKHQIERKNKELIKQNRLLRENESKLQNEIVEKNRFFSIIAHDVRSPFTALLGLSSLLATSATTLTREDVTEMASGVHRQAEHIFKLLENLLEWSKMQMKQISFNPEIINLKDAIIEAVVVNKPAAEKKSISIITPQISSVEVFADSTMLDTIIRNLISNAIKFTYEGGEITIDVKEKIRFIEISVIDTGVGISEENIKKIFNYSTIHTTLGTSKEKGTGLGLVLVKDFVEKHGGRITISSREGVGTTVSFMLPKPMTN